MASDDDEFDTIDLHTDVKIAVNSNYRGLVEAIGTRLGRRRGWQRRAAEMLGVSPSLISQVLSTGGQARLSDDVLGRAQRSLGIERDFFVVGFDPDEALDTEAGRRALAAALLDARDPTHLTHSVQQGPPALVTAHRWLTNAVDDVDAEPGDGFDDVSEGFHVMLMAVPFVRSFVASRDPSLSPSRRRRALARAQLEFGLEFAALRNWLVANPRERVVGDPP
ncbi:MAG: helix-turn-helix transcriptional regulator [Deltaproteobacteria bacterium]|nr:helix-turn-helix transcriptional regulator [Deltaproteobacteria bacterium]